MAVLGDRIKSIFRHVAPQRWRERGSVSQSPMPSHRAVTVML
jgi:hypothetical protein